jgi:alkylation response protein AidB-like acyl-CoA dehydrogenase
VSETPLGAPARELRAFLATALPKFRAEHGRGHDFESRLVWQRILDAEGWAAPSWPVADGGRGLGVVDRVQCDLEFARADAPTVAGILGINNVGPTIAAFGTDAQRESLPRIRSGEEIWCQGFSEPGAGSDLAALATRADLDGETFVVNGQKVWTSDAMRASHCMLLARTSSESDRHGGISVLLVPMDTPGIEIRPLRQLTGEEEFAEVFFTDARVPADALLGPIHEGWRVTMTTLGYERSGVIAMAARLEREVGHVVEELAGTTLPPVVRDDVVRRYIEARIVGLLGARALAALGEGGRPGAAQSVIKFAWSQASQHLGETVLAAAGTPGLLVERDRSDIASRYLQARASTIAAGTTEVMKNILAERVLGLPKD